VTNMPTLSHYINLHLRPDPETTPHQLLAALFTRLHRALAAAQKTPAGPNIAVGFPGYDGSRHTLGECLRLYGDEVALQFWATGAWLGSLRDHLLNQEMGAVRSFMFNHAGQRFLPFLGFLRVGVLIYRHLGVFRSCCHGFLLI